MNGPEHYRMAEKLLDHMEYRRDVSDTEKARLVAGAQVHAMLALTAATTLHTAHEFYEIADDVERWAQATSAAAVQEGQADD